MENILEVAAQVAVLFVLMGCGAVLRISGLLGPKTMDGMVNLLLYVVAPCVIIDCFQRPFDGAMLGSLWTALLVSVVIHAVMMFVAWALVRCRDENVRRPLLLSAVFSNAGFMGFPLEQAMLGDEGVFFGVAYVAAFNIFMWSWGVHLMKGGGADGAGGGGGEMWKMILNPGTAAIAIGLPVFLLSVKLPEVIASPVHHLANMNTPLALTVVGYSLAGARFGRVSRIGAVYVAALLRLVAGPVVALAILYPFAGRIDREMAVATVIASSAPVGAMVAMFSVKYRRDVDVGVAMVSATTLASILTMPPFIALAMSVFG